MDTQGAVYIDARMNYSQLEQDLADIKKDIEDIEKSLDSDKARDNELTQSIADMEQEAKNAKAVLEEMKTAKEAAFSPTEIQEQTSYVSRLEQQIAGVEKNIAQSEVAVDRLSQKLEQMQLANVGARKPEYSKADMKAIQDEISVRDKAIQSWYKRLQQVNAQRDIEKKKLEEMKAAQRDAYSPDQIKQQEATVAALTRNLHEATGEQSALGQKISEETSQLEELRFQFGQKAIEIIPAKTEVVLQAIGMTIKTIAVGIKNGIVLGFRLAAEAAKRLFAVAKRVGKAMWSVGKTIVGAAAQLNIFKRIADKIAPTFKRIGGLAKRAFIFATITSAFRYLKQTISAYLKTNTELMAAMKTLKGAFLTAFQPIFQAVLPALTALVNGATAALSAVASLTAALFGTTAKTAQNNAKALNEQAIATENAGSAAAKATKQLAGFDEINQLTSPNDASGGLAEKLDATFDADVDTKEWESWGEALSALIDKLLAKLPDFSQAMEKSKEKINGFAVNLKEMFTYDGILEKLRTLGSEIGKTISDWFAGVDWATLGAGFGAGLNTLINLIDSFMSNVDWKNIGASIATFLNNAIKEIDWAATGRVLFSGFKAGILILAGFIENLDMKELGKAITEFVTSFVNELSDTLKAVDWEEIGHQIKELFVSIDWAQIAEAVFTALGNAFGASVQLLWGLLKDAWQSVVDWWYEHAYEDGEFTLEGFLEGMKDAIVGIATWIYDHIVKPFVDGFKEMFGISSPSKVMEEQGGYVMDGLKQGISNKVQEVVDAVKGVYDRVTQWFSDTVKPTLTVQYWEGQFSGISDGIKGVLNGVLGFVETCINWIVDKINGINIQIPDWASALIGISSIGFNLKRVSIPRLAQGAVIPANQQFLAVLGDQKEGTNIETPLQTMIDAFKAALAETEGSVTNIYLDGQLIAQNTAKHLNSFTRMGRNALLV